MYGCEECGGDTCAVCQSDKYKIGSSCYDGCQFLPNQAESLDTGTCYTTDALNTFTGPIIYKRMPTSQPILRGFLNTIDEFMCAARCQEFPSCRSFDYFANNRFCLIFNVTSASVQLVDGNNVHFDRDVSDTSASFSGGAYIAFNGYSILSNLSLSFATSFPTGVLLRQGQTVPSSSTDFVSVSLSDGYLTLRAAVNGQVFSATTGSMYNTGAATQFSLTLGGTILRLLVGRETLRLALPAVPVLSSPLMLGNFGPHIGVSDLEATAYWSVPFYNGCMSNLLIAGNNVRFFQDATTFVNVRSC